jgi:PAS domain S-box-containing protein
MSLLDDSENFNLSELTDHSTPPTSNAQDKLHAILNVLRGYEEFTINLDGTIISSNLEAVNVTGYEEWEVIGKHFSIFYTAQDIKGNRPQLDLDAALAEGRFTADCWKLKKRQAQFWARIKVIPIMDVLQCLRGYKIILRDATHKVISDIKVQRLRNEYLNLYHNSTFGILRFNQDSGHLTLANKKALEILGIADFHDSLFQDAFLLEKDIDRFRLLVNRQRYVNNFEFELKYSGTGKRWASFDCKSYVTTGLVEGIIIDITERKGQEMSLQKLSNDLNTFIYHASHDLRAPLTTILGLLNLMDIEEEVEKKHYSELIRRRVILLDLLLKDLSAIAFNSHSEINYERIFAEEEIKFILKDFIGDKKIATHLRVDLPADFVSDIIRFRTIMKNIISNAVKYHNQMEKQSSIAITVHADRGKLLIAVEDNGIGIEEEQMQKIYNMFHRGHSSLSGSGLGLYIVRSMVDKLGGTITISSTIGKGTLVNVELPMNHLQHGGSIV